MPDENASIYLETSRFVDMWVGLTTLPTSAALPAALILFGWFLLSVGYCPSGTKQSATRLSARGREPGPGMRRARRREFQVSSEMQLAEADEGMGEAQQRVEGDLGESIGRSELSPFQREMESQLSPPGEGLTARDILEAHRIYEEESRGFEDDEDAGAGPLRDGELGMDQHANLQVIIFFRFLFPERCSSTPELLEPVL